MSGVCDFPTDKRYYDTYVYSTVDEVYNCRILGDASREMGSFGLKFQRNLSSWYDDELWFVSYFDLWFSHGVDFGYGSGANVFDGEPLCYEYCKFSNCFIC